MLGQKKREKRDVCACSHLNKKMEGSVKKVAKSSSSSSSSNSIRMRIHK